jgi:SOS-response transcriptional repressor LexA
MNKLTARQEQILGLIRDAIENTGFPPTRAEIAQTLGCPQRGDRDYARRVARHSPA